MPVDVLAAVDAWFERAYRRFGRRVFPAYVVVAWCGGLAFCLAFAGLLVRAAPATAADFARMFRVMFPAWLLGLGPAMTGSMRLLRRAERADPELGWRLLLRLPFDVTRWCLFVGCLVCFPLGTFSAAHYFGFDGSATTLLFAAVYPVLLVLIGVGFAFAGQLVVRPLLREASGRLSATPVPAPAVPVRLKLLVGVPAISLSMAAVGALAGATPGTDPDTLMHRMLLAMGLVLVVFVPVTLLMAYSLPQPLGELLVATERLRSGDFGARVAELSADEYGRLARSFNETVAGLARGRALAEDNEHLLGEVRSSRARIVTASDAERRRVERNLHDGAQQRLVALSLDLRLLEEQAADDEARSGLQRAGADLRSALDELRELARGLHPPVLATDGLRPALEQLACRSPVPVSISAPDDRFTSAVESTAYFVAGEALANVAKYAQATRADVCVQRLNGRLVIEIVDDGIGGAQADGASGLAGLVDRVAALGGELSVHSPVGGGTRVRASIPAVRP